ncbi:MAG: transporter substrate-binding domain-containing protein [Roseateles sp.]|nr:MAG: transporter substrate-binding domain-containing protein [Roseateles sp.]
MTRPLRQALLLALGLVAAATVSAADAELLFIAPANHTLPFVGLQDGVLQRGLLKDLGEAIAARLGRSARFVVMPARRVSAALQRGEADGLCYTTPQWLGGELGLHWSRPLFDYTGVVARRRDVPVLERLEQLAGEPLGTVAGYYYPEVERALGAGFARDDAPDMSLNLAKLAAGRTRYALTEQLTLSYAQREQPGQGLLPMLQTTHYPTYCVFSPRRGLPLKAVDAALERLVADGSLERLLARYR